MPLTKGIQITKLFYKAMPAYNPYGMYKIALYLNY